ncbi:dihydrolipoamide acetyltransferase family protein [Arthrobacter sp. SIMBA_036]|uniref:dihydrolipoamide acetyltransferase family protein n=1 Tax=Arthrobacter sp. SIMBA_036 TaxID=3085778 RepID=UPI00397ACCB9
MTVKKFNLPDVGEGLTEAEVVAWKVKPGDTVAINDVLCEIETAKSLVELPSPFAGTVTELLVEEGITVEVGTAIIAVSEGHEGDSAPATPQAPPVSPEVDEVFTPVYGKLSAEDNEQPATSPLVGSGPKADAVKRRARKRPLESVVAAAPVAEDAEGTVQDVTSVLQANAAEVPAPKRVTSVAQESPATRGNSVGVALTGLVNKVLAKPPVRKFARDLGIDLADVVPTGHRGEVTREDLVSYQAQRDAELDQAESFWSASKKPQDQRIERIPVKGVRKATARAMVDSAFSAPHVSIFVDVDASRTMEFVKRLKVSRDFEGIKVSPLLILAKAVIWAAARNPSVNATWVDDSDGKGAAEIHVKHYMNLGIAAATPRGLMVPNIKDAQDLSLKELALALNELATKARAGKTQPAEMQGGTLTVTNIGALGIDTGTPIINPGEVAIVAFGTIKQKPWVLDGEVIPRWITTLGGSFDHRVVDGDLSARFMADVAAILEEPALLLD